MPEPWQHVMETKSSHQQCQQEGRDKGQRCYRRTLQKGSRRLSDLLYVGIKEGSYQKSPLGSWGNNVVGRKAERQGKVLAHGRGAEFRFGEYEV